MGLLPMVSGGVDGAALGELLQQSRLFDGALSREIAQVASQFPAISQRNIFVEYDLQPRPQFGGFGFGFPPALLEQWLATDHRFLQSARGRDLRAALSDDPFAADHESYLNLIRDGDPDWIEYDGTAAGSGQFPFVFHRFPARFQSIANLAELAKLSAIAPGLFANDQLRKLIAAALATAPVGMYRVGTARLRGKGWRRLILDHLDRDQIAAALASLGVAKLPATLELADALYEAIHPEPGTLFSLSIDLEDGMLTNVDVEAPYFLRIKDLEARRDRLARLALALVQRNIIDESAEAWLNQSADRRILSRTSPRQLRVMLHHLKFRCIGAPENRAKAYLHLAMSDAPADML